MIVTPLAAALIVPLYIWLAAQIITHRKGEKISLGDGADPKLLKKIRAHGNFAEYAPLSLVLLGLIELGGAPLWGIILLAAMAVLGRYIHAVAFYKGSMNFDARTTGMALTLTMLGLSAFVLLLQSVF